MLTNSLITSPCLVIDAPVPANYQQQSIMAPESANTIVLLRPRDLLRPPTLSSVHATRQNSAPFFLQALIVHRSKRRRATSVLGREIYRAER